MAHVRRVPWIVGLGLAAAVPQIAAAQPGAVVPPQTDASGIAQNLDTFDGVIAPPCLENGSAGSATGARPVKCELPPEDGTDVPPVIPGSTGGGTTTPPPATGGTGTSPPPTEPGGGTTTPPPAPTDTTSPGTTTPGTTPPPAEKPKPTFGYNPPGDLLKQDQEKGRGRPKTDRKIYLKDIIFPLKLGDGLFPHMNSQIWGRGGGGWNNKGAAGGSERDAPNYDPFNQRDNYCEVRTHPMPLCPAGGTGHQGQDIRPPTPENSKWEAVAVVDGTITYRSNWSTLRMKGNDGTIYEYLHLNPNTYKVKVGDKVKQGDVLGKVSNYMDGPNHTTIHLHFNAKQLTKLPSGKTDSVFVPVFSSLVAALRKAKGLDPGIDKDGNLIAEFPYEFGVAEPPPPPVTPPAPPVEPPQPPVTPPAPPVEPPQPPVTPPAPPVEPPQPPVTPPAPPVEPPQPPVTPPAPPVEPPQPPVTPPAPPVEPPQPPVTPPPAPPVEPPPAPPATQQGYWGTAWEALSNWWNKPWW